MTSCTKGNLNKGSLLTSILLRQKSHVEKLAYTVKNFKKLSNQVMRFLPHVFFQKFQVAVPWNEVRHKEMAQ